MSINPNFRQLPGGFAKPRAMAETLPATDEGVVSALIFTCLALADVGCAHDAEEMVAATREAHGDSLVLKIASVAATIASGKLNALDLVRHMTSVFTAEEMELPTVVLIHSTLLFLEKDKVCQVDKNKYVAAKGNLEKLASSTDPHLSRRAKSVLGVA
jgi:hypothetical protein